MSRVLKKENKKPPEGGSRSAALSGEGLERALRQALDHQEFELHYQPKIDLRNHCLTGAEALIRWNRTGDSLIYPSAFIPQAEKSGLITEIGNWAIEEVCRQRRVWLDSGLPEIGISVNVSADQFRTAKLLATISNAHKKYDLGPKWLELELTESMLMEKPEEAAGLLADLRQLGVGLSLDDFGTGYSSLSYLSIFPIDSLKIDRSFVREIVTNPRAATIANSIIALAQRLGLRVIAEGVETEAQMGYLRKNGCHEMQGFYYSGPLAADQFGKFLQEPRVLDCKNGWCNEERTILVVDDEPHILSAVKRTLNWDNYRVLVATSAGEALDMLACQPVQVVLADVRMPEMNGIELLSRIKVLHPDTVRMILTGYTELDSVIKAVNEGAIYKFLTKPWEHDQLRNQIRNAFQYYEAIIRPGFFT